MVLNVVWPDVAINDEYVFIESVIGGVEPVVPWRPLKEFPRSNLTTSTISPKDAPSISIIEVPLVAVYSLSDNLTPLT